MDRTTREGHPEFPHFRNAPSECNFVAHRGHAEGGCTSVLLGRSSLKFDPSECLLPSRSAFVAWPMTSVILGITSPHLTIITRSPIFKPNRLTSPGLWSVVFSTVTPETITGATLATGVTLPVRPVCQSTDMTTVIASYGGNFHASAHLG